MSDILTAEQGAVSTPASAPSEGPTLTARAPTDETPTAGNGASAPTKSWTDMLPHGYKDNEILGGYDSFEDMVKEHISLKEQADTPLLGEDATPEQEAELFGKLGMPESAEGYDIATEIFPEAYQTDEVKAKLAEGCFAAHLTQKQAAQFAEWYAGYLGNIETAREEQVAVAAEEAMKAIVSENNLPSEDAAGPILTKVRTVMSEFFGKDGAEAIENAGLQNNMPLIRGFIKLAEFMGEDHFREGGTPPTEPEEKTAAQIVYGDDRNMTGGAKIPAQTEYADDEHRQQLKRLYGAS